MGVRGSRLSRWGFWLVMGLGLGVVPAVAALEPFSVPPSDDFNCAKNLADLGGLLSADDLKKYRQLLSENYDPVERVGLWITQLEPSRLMDFVRTADPAKIRQAYARERRRGSLTATDGDVAREPLEAQFCFDLFQFVFYTGDALWVGQDAEQHRMVVLAALQSYFRRFKGVVAAFDRTAEIKKALGLTEAAVFERYLGLRWPSADMFRRFLFPLYPRAGKMLAFHSAVRQEIQLAEMVSALIRRAGIDKASENQLSPESQRQLQWIVAAGATPAGEAAAIVQTVYGKNEKDTTSPDLHALAKKLDLLQNEIRRFRAHSLASHVARLRRFDEIIAASRAAAGRPPREDSDRDVDELRLRGWLAAQEFTDVRERHEKILAENTRLKFTVTFAWDENVFRERSDRDEVLVTMPFRGESEWEARHGSEVREVTFGDILRGHYDESVSRGIVTGVSGRREIETAAEEVREYEGAFLVWIEAAEQELARAREDQGSVDPKNWEVLDRLRKNWATRTQMLQRYLRKSEAAVKAVWRYDSYDNFQRRGAGLLERYRIVGELLAVQLDSFRRGLGDKAELRFYFPAYADELANLKSEMSRDRWAKGAVAAGAVGAGAAAVRWGLGW